MTPEERERMIRSHGMTANERFLIGLLDEARGKRKDGCQHGTIIVQWGKDVGVCTNCGAEVES